MTMQILKHLGTEISQNVTSKLQTDAVEKMMCDNSIEKLV
jgi:hypothetical protein